MRPSNRSPALAFLVAIAISACAPLSARIPPTPLALADGATLARPAPIRIAIVGGAPTDAIAADVIAWDPDVLVLVGDLVPRSTARAWREVGARWGATLPRALPVVGVGERRGDRRLRGLRAAFPSLGVQALEAGWWRVDLVADDVRWRWILLDAGAADQADQRFWLPKVVAGRYDHLVVVSGAPLDPAGEGLLALVRDGAPATALTAVIVGGGGPAALALPEGPFGHVALEVGRADRRWWRATLDGDALELAVRERSADGFRDSTPIRSSAEIGWSAVGGPDPGAEGGPDAPAP